MPYVTCPDCDHESLAPRELIGLEWACPKCGVYVIVADGDRPAPMRRRKRNSPGPWVAAAVLAAAGLVVFGVLWLAVSRSGRNQERAIAAQREKDRAAEKARDREREPAGWPARVQANRPAEPAAYPDDSEPRDSSSPARVVLGFALLLVGILFYFAPTMIALVRGHNNVAPIVVVNFFLGWALIGWVIALAWAFTDLKHVESRRRSYL